MDTVKRFNITRGVDNTYTFTIKQNGSIFPMVITSGDTFVAKMYSLNPADQLVLTKNLRVVDAEKGKVGMDISAEDTNLLIHKEGTYADRYYTVAVYRLVLECTTVNNGFFIAHIGRVYVK